MRAAISLIIILTLAATSKIILPPDDYYADAFLRAALHFFDLDIFKVKIVLLLLAAVIAYVAILMLFSIWLPNRACLYALGDLAWIAFHLLAAVSTIPCMPAAVTICGLRWSSSLPCLARWRPSPP